MPDPLVLVGIAVLAGILVSAVAAPERTVMALGIFLFVQSAIVRVDPIPDLIRSSVSRLDEIVLLALTVRFVISQVGRRRLVIAAPLWGMIALAAIGIASTIQNHVPLVQAAVGLFLALKAGLWLFVASQLRIRRNVLMRYLTALAILFLAAVGLAVLQFAGLTLPWEPHMRRSGELAATSIWNQHTVFGSAMAILAGLAVVFLSLAEWRRFGFVLVVATGTGVVLSTVRRLLISLPLAGAAVVKESAAWRPTVWLNVFLGIVGRKALLLVLAALAVLTVVFVGPRMTHVIADTWDEYVVHAATRDRYALYGGGFKLAARSPILGRGPGTFGSYASVLFDSPAYREVHVKLPDNLKMGAPYASIIGEFGVAGSFAFGAFIILLLLRLRPVLRSSGAVMRAVSAAAIFMVIDLTIESVVHPSFTDSFTAFFAMSAAGISLHHPLAAAGEASGDDPSAVPRPNRRWIAICAIGAVIFIAGLIGAVSLLGAKT